MNHNSRVVLENNSAIFYCRITVYNYIAAKKYKHVLLDIKKFKIFPHETEVLSLNLTGIIYGITLIKTDILLEILNYFLS